MRLIASSTEIGRAFVAPPGLPDARAATLRQAFAQMLNDEEFKADAAQLRLDLEPQTGAEMQDLVTSLTRPRASVIERVRRYMSGG